MWTALLINSGDIVEDPSLDANFWPRFLMQVVIILTICKLLGIVLGYIKQPPVIGEILGGIIVGPSVLGQWRWWSYHVFQPSTISSTSNNYITLVADLGIILFMFLLGLELDERLVRRLWRTSFPIAVASVLFPFAIGIALATWLYDTNNSYLSTPVDRTAFYLFTGASMSFTALPVLGSLLSATGLITTPVGIQAISCATVDDVLAWCVLAVSTAFAKGDDLAGLVTFALAVAYIGVMAFIVRPILARVHEHYRAKGQENSHTFNYTMIITLLLAAFFSEIINIHSFFGAFIAGLCAPKSGRWHLEAADKLALVTKELLLPLFFVSSGAKTDIGALNTGHLVGITIAVWVIATFAKFTPATLMTKLMTGRDWRFAVTVGVLMNTRGLVELIALNIGYSLGILSQPIFTVLVLMALLTTFCTAPLVYLIYQRTYVPELEAGTPGHMQVLHTVKDADMQDGAADAEVVWHHGEDEVSVNRTSLELEPRPSPYSYPISPLASEPLAPAPSTPKHFNTSGSILRSGGAPHPLTTSEGGHTRMTMHTQGGGREDLIRSGGGGRTDELNYRSGGSRGRSQAGTPAESPRGGDINRSGSGVRNGVNVSGSARGVHSQAYRTPHPADMESH